MTRLGERLLSFGTLIGCCDGRGVVAWRSTDGTSWELIESDSPLFREGYLVSDVVAAELGLLATDIQYSQYAGRSWFWTPETSWTETTPVHDANGTSGTQIQDAAWANGRFVVVGVRAEIDIDVPAEEWPTTATSWVSSDGRSWEVSTPSSAMENAVMAAVAPLPEGEILAIGSVGNTAGADPLPAAWTSLDGVAWTPVDAPTDGKVIATQLVSFGDGLLAVGTDGEQTSTWTSADGLSWRFGGTLVGRPGPIAAGDGEFVLMILREAADPASPFDTFVAHGALEDE